MYVSVTMKIDRQSGGHRICPEQTVAGLLFGARKYRNFLPHRHRDRTGFKWTDAPALVFFYLLLSTKWSLGITVACVSGGCCGFDWVENCCCCWGCDCDEDSAQSSSPFELKQTFELVQSAMHSTFLNRRIIHHIKSLKDEVQINPLSCFLADRHTTGRSAGLLSIFCEISMKSHF